MTAWFVDPSVLLLAVGGAHKSREHCRQFIASSAQRHERLHLSVDGGQEFLFHRLRRTSTEQAIGEFDRLDRMAVWHPFDVQVLHGARDLVAKGHARGRDAVHIATALAAGFTRIVSTDRDFDGVPGLQRIDPAQL